MQKATVRMSPEDPNVTITLTVLGKQKILQRAKTEELSKALKRLQLSAAPQADRKAKRKKQQPAASQPTQQEQEPFVGLYYAPDADVGTGAGAASIDSSSNGGGGSGSASLASGTATTGAQVPGDKPNGEAWPAARLLVLGSERYEVEVNPPTCEKLEVLGVKLSEGDPLCPLPTLRFAEEAACRWRWLRKDDAGQHWQPLGCEQCIYTPGGQDVGRMLRVECTPGTRRQHGTDSSSAGQASSGNGADGGETWLGEPCSLEVGPILPAARRMAGEEVEPGYVERAAVAGPPPPAPRGVRVVCYNLLAEQYSAMEHAKKVIFAHVQPEILDMEYRRPLLLKELLAYDGDVLALQEVDEKMFAKYLQPHLEQHGYQGLYASKHGAVAEGEALFWKASRFTLLAHQRLSLKQAFHDSLHGQGGEAGSEGGGEGGGGGSGGDWARDPAAPLLPLVQASPELAHALQRVTQVAQMALLLPVQDPTSRSDGSNNTDGSNAAGAADAGPLCVVNSHLFYHPRGPHIRTIHVATILNEAERWSADVVAAAAAAGGAGGAAGSGRQPALLLCGDLNSNILDKMPGALELLRSGRLPGDYCDWLTGASFKFSRDGDGDGAGDSDGDSGDGDAEEGEAKEEEAEGGQVKTEGGGRQTAGAQKCSGGGGGGGGRSSGAGGGAAAAVDGAPGGLGVGATAELDDVEGDDGVDPDAALADIQGGVATSGGRTYCPDSGRLVGLDLVSPFRLASADHLSTPYSNLVPAFVGMLDYVWHEPMRMACRGVAPMPGPEKVASFLPSEAYPSDHLPVIADLEWLPLAEQRHWRPLPDGSHAPPSPEALSQTQAASSPGAAAAAAVPALEQPATRSQVLPGEGPVPTSSCYQGALHPLPSRGCYASAALAVLKRGEVVAVDSSGLTGLAVDAASPSAVKLAAALHSSGSKESSRDDSSCLVPGSALEGGLGRRWTVCYANVHAAVQGLGDAAAAALPAGLVNGLLAEGAEVVLPIARITAVPAAAEMASESGTIGVYVPRCELLHSVALQLDRSGTLALLHAATHATGGSDAASLRGLWPVCGIAFEENTAAVANAAAAAAATVVSKNDGGDSAAAASKGEDAASSGGGRVTVHLVQQAASGGGGGAWGYRVVGPASTTRERCTTLLTHHSLCELAAAPTLA